jgi:23S rRNA pseudouridine2605 synthase
MEQDNIQEKLSDEQKNNSREGYQKEFRPAGRSPRPRISNSTRPVTGGFERQTFSRRNADDEGGFRPEGFGASLQSNAQQRPYRPRTSYNNNSGYQPRPRFNQDGQQGGYQQRPRYNQDDRQPGYQPRPRFNQDGQQGGYQPRPRYNQDSHPHFKSDDRQSGYQPRPRFHQDGQQGGYQPRPRYNQDGQQGGYQPRPYGQHGAHKPFNATRKPYDPNAKYSLKKRIEYKEQHFDPNEPVRLNKFLANAGVCSRREADEFIQAGVVTVNGQVITELGTKVLRTDEVRFHDQPVSIEKKVYVLLNKPKDYVTTSDDPQQRKTVMDLVKDACSERIYPVGRLDRNTTGVLLLTNDGDLASKLTHPKYLKKKIYHVYLDRNVTAHDLQQIAEGITLDDGEIKADDVQYASPTDKKQVGIEIHSGKNRIVRRIFEALGYKVTKLDRVQFAGLTKKNLRRGDWRYLTEEEVDRLRMGAYE